jgi:ABC-2 type transport system permease protein
MLFALIQKEFRVLSRDAHALAALFVLPAIFIVIMSMALKDVYSPRINNLAWAVIDQDNSTLSLSLIKQWSQENGAPVATPENWQASLRQGHLKYVLKIEKGAGNDLAKVKAPDRQRILLLADPAIDYGVFTSLTAKAQALATNLRVETFTAKLPTEIKINPKAMSGEHVVKAELLDTGPRPTSVQHNVPAWLVFGMFFVITTISGLFVEERSHGTLQRLLSLGAPPLTILIAKVLPFVLINLLQAGLMLAVGVYVIPLLGGDALSLKGINWIALLAMLLAISFAAICLGLFVSSLVKSQAQASTFGPMINIFMAAIGGVMVPTFVMPSVMQTLSQLSPMNWALEGFLNVLMRGGNLDSIRKELALLFLLAIISLILAYFHFRLKKSS